jgi:hypothetical protein
MGAKERTLTIYQGLVEQFLPMFYRRRVTPEAKLLFNKYQNLVDRNDQSSKLLIDSSTLIYQGEASRRESSNTRGGSLLAATGVVGTIIVAAGTLASQRIPATLSTLAWIVVILYVTSLVYIGIAMVLAVKVQTPRQVDVLGPDNLLPADADPDVYGVSVTNAMLTSVIKNYSIINSQSGELRRGFLCFRNGAIALIIAGILVPFAGISSPSSPQQAPGHHTHGQSGSGASTSTIVPSSTTSTSGTSKAPATTSSESTGEPLMPGKG